MPYVIPFCYYVAVGLLNTFWTHFHREGDCLVWSKGKTSAGYGEVWVPSLKKVKYTHHVAFYLAHGYWPRYLLHTCDNPPCGEKSHLVDADHPSNMLDAHAKGRLYKLPRFEGSAHPQAKVTEEIVRAIRRRAYDGEPIAFLGKEYGISRSTVQRIVQGVLWKHVDQNG